MASDEREGTGEAPPRRARDWERRYRAGNTGWDLGAPPAVLLDLLRTLPPEPLHVFVPGCGRGHDALAWARAGHRVLAADFAPSAVAGARALAAAEALVVDVRELDVLDPPEALDGRFDAIWEQTCYCAIAPDDRDAYARACARLLRPGGRLFALLWHHGRPGGPPYDVTPADVARRFPPWFAREALEPVVGAPDGRAGELLVRLRRTQAPPPSRAAAP